MIFAAALLSFAACQEEMAPETTPNEDEIFDYPIEMTFTAGNEDATKTVISGTSITWESDDQIKVLWSKTGYNMAKAEPFGENTCAKFTTNVQEADTYYAVHPYAAESSYSDGNIVVTIPSEQGGAFENANIAVAKATENYAFPFRHLVGIVEFSTDTPGKVTISGAEDDVLTGTVTVTGFDENGYPVYNEDKVTDASSTIEIEVSQAGTYYAAFLPSATLKCLSVKVEGSEATEYALSPNQLQMARGKVWELGNIDGKFGKNLFVTAAADGNGDGKTWETALTFQQMANMVAARNAEGPSAPSGDTNVAVDKAGTEYLAWHNGVRAAALDGVTFHIAEGTYKTSSYVRISFPNRENAVKLSFKGGYSSESKGTDLSKRFVDAEDVTVMTGEDKRRHFFVRYSSNLTFDGITFANGKPDFDGGSILFNESGTSILNFNNCKFDSNSAGAHPGGAICGGGEAKDVGTAIFNKCEFISNSSNAGGAVYANSGVWKFKDCTIKNNSSTGASGAFHMEADTEVSISGGSFETNTAVSDGGAMRVASKSFVADDVDFIGNKGAQTTAGNSQGGAIYFANNESGSERTVSNCLFKENTVDASCAPNPGSLAEGENESFVRGGAIYIQSKSPDVTFTSCTFELNKQLNVTTYKAHGGGAIYSTKSFKAKGCTFTYNEGYYGGAVGVEAGTLTFDDCDFVSNKSGNRAGAVYSKSSAAMTMTDCDFKSNESTDNGGACWLTTTGKTTFDNCVFDGNKAPTQLGGAFYINGSGVVDFKGGEIKNSYAGGSNGGGAFYISGAATINITDTQISGNEAKNAGGAIWVSHNSTKLNINGTAKFTGNKAGTNGGAIYVKDDITATVTVSGAVTFSNNTAGTYGGALYTKGAVTSISGATFDSNSSVNNGGALHLQTKSSYTINDCLFKNNSLTGANVGGAIYSNATSQNNTISSVVFDSNTTKNGGAIYWSGTGRLMIDKSVFKSNTSTSQGAAVRMSAGSVYINASAFTSNKSSEARTGGVIRVEGGSMFINNSCFYANTAAQPHTALVLVKGETTVLNSSLYESDATMACVRVYYNGAGANLYNNVLLNPNTATNEGTVRVGYFDKPGSITSSGYNYTTEWKTLVNDGVSGSLTMADTDNIIQYSDASALFTQASTTDGRGYYTWTKPAEVTGTTKSNVTAFLNGITGGSDFASWLGTVGGLTHDLAGNERPAEGAWYPGCYQGE